MRRGTSLLGSFTFMKLLYFLCYNIGMAEYNFTRYFEKEVLRKRPYIQKKWCIYVVENPVAQEMQEYNRYRFWGEVEEL